jgi:hypothetical protein
MSYAANMSSLENMGLYSSEADGAFGRDMWKGSKRSEITALLKHMPASSKTPYINRLILRALLTRADTNRLENDIDIEDGEDLLTLRLEKLLEAGAYNQAFELYNQLKDPPYHERLARAGVLSMLYMGEKSAACLETNILTEQFGEIEFWNTLSLYCTATLTDSKDELDALNDGPAPALYNLARDEDYLFPYSAEAFDALGTLEQAVIASEEKLDVSGLKSIEVIPNAHIQILLRQDNLKPETAYRLAIAGTALGLLKPEETKDPHKAFFRPGGHGESDEYDAMPKEDWKKIPYYLAQLKQADEDAHWDIIRQALPLMDKYGPDAFMVIAPFIQRTPPESTTLDELDKAVRIMISADIDMPYQWIETIKNTVETTGITEKNTPQALFLLSAAYFSSAKNSQKEALLALLNTALQQSEPYKQQNMNFIMKNLDNAVAERNNQHTVYEKDFFLTYASDYVMHSHVVWDRLLEASQNKAAGETILLVTVLLHDQGLHKIYPTLLRDILLRTKDVGLTKLSRDIAIMASLEKNFKKEK